MRSTDHDNYSMTMLRLLLYETPILLDHIRGLLRHHIHRSLPNHQYSDQIPNPSRTHHNMCIGYKREDTRIDYSQALYAMKA
jgi:hypothetical protein